MQILFLAGELGKALSKSMRENKDFNILLDRKALLVINKILDYSDTHRDVKHYKDILGKRMYSTYNKSTGSRLLDRLDLEDLG